MRSKSLPIVMAAAAVLSAGGLVGCRQPEQLQTDPQRACIDARTRLMRAAESDSAATRANALEAMANVMDADAGPELTEALDDASPAVRFAAAMGIGDVRYAPARDKLARMAEDKQAEPDRRVYVAVLYALYELGERGYVSPLGDLLFDREAEVRADAAMVMGRMGEPSAIAPLKALLADEQDPAVQLQVVEALAKLGDDRSAALLEAYTKTPFVDEQLVAIPAMADIGGSRARSLLRELLAERHPPRVRVAAAGGLGRLGWTHEDVYDYCVEALRSPRVVLGKAYGEQREVTDVEVRSLQRLAAIALGWMERMPAVDALHVELDNADGGVAVAAAMSIHRLLPCESTEPIEAPSEPETAASDGEPERIRLHTAGAKE